MKKDKNFVDTNDMSEVKYWAEKFGVKTWELLKTIDENSNKVAELKKIYKDKTIVP